VGSGTTGTDERAEAVVHGATRDRRRTHGRRVGAAAAGAAALAAAAVVAAVAVGGDDLAGEAAAADTEPGASPADLVDGHAAAEEERDAEAARSAAEAEEARLAEEAAERAEEERLAAEERDRAERAEEERLAAEERADAERAAAEAREQLLDAQERLRELGYLVGAADGEQGQQTTAAVMAFQAVQGLGVDGVLGPRTTAALQGTPNEPALRGGAATRIEVDVDRQVLHLVEGDRRVTTMKASTGRGGTFESQDGQTLRAETPVGTFTIDRRIAGEHQSSYGIGGMWDPLYFHGPWAIHGSPNVPAGPASAGCVRISLADGRWLFDRVPNGTPVVLYGGTHVFTP
jgi:lipoprotein-anchoring transpeptidase ErfK/SrfK